MLAPTITAASIIIVIKSNIVITPVDSNVIINCGADDLFLVRNLFMLLLFRILILIVAIIRLLATTNADYWVIRSPLFAPSAAPRLATLMVLRQWMMQRRRRQRRRLATAITLTSRRHQHIENIDHQRSLPPQIQGWAAASMWGGSVCLDHDQVEQCCLIEETKAKGENGI